MILPKEVLNNENYSTDLHKKWKPILEEYEKIKE